MKNYTPEIKKILVPVNIGSSDVIDLKQAMIFQEIYGCKIILLQVIIEKPFYKRILRPIGLKNQKEKSEANLKKFALNYFDGNIPDFIRLEVTKGDLIKQILETANKLNCDLIIIKKRSRIVKRFNFLKNENADKLIYSSLCPVLTIHGDEIKDKI